jgi:hypothetical protein
MTWGQSTRQSNCLGTVTAAEITSMGTSMGKHGDSHLMTLAWAQAWGQSPQQRRRANRIMGTVTAVAARHGDSHLRSGPGTELRHRDRHFGCRVGTGTGTVTTAGHKAWGQSARPSSPAWGQSPDRGTTTGTGLGTVTSIACSIARNIPRGRVLQQSGGTGTVNSAADGPSDRHVPGGSQLSGMQPGGQSP